MPDDNSPALDVWLALIGSILMFAGWVLAIVPVFHHAKDFILPLVLGIIGFGIVLVPAGLAFFATVREPAEKRGVGVVIVSILPAAVLFVITVAAFPLAPLFRVLALVAEFIGMGAYGWAFWAYHRGAASTGPSTRRGRGE
ncbi:MAG TPA: hypothetical protein VFA78_07875 [Chloroflexota bacterium]|nr:hypothetical protein [Chloroflexota bacterium]